jgi:hypothetical protein
MRYAVRCLDCGLLLHEATTGALSRIETHERLTCEGDNVHREDVP